MKYILNKMDINNDNFIEDYLEDLEYFEKVKENEQLTDEDLKNISEVSTNNTNEKKIIDNIYIIKI